MERRGLVQNQFVREYDGSKPLTAQDPNALAPGSSNVVWRNGRLSAFNGLLSLSPLLGSRYMTNAAESFGGLGSFADSTVKGSVLKILNGLFAIGNGAVYYHGAALGFSAVSALQLKLLQSGSWSAATYQAGLPQAGAPTLGVCSTIGSGLTGKNIAGSYSAMAFLVRDATGAKGIASEMSNIVTIGDTSLTSGKTLRATFPLIGSSGADYWGLALAPRNFGSTGPHFVLKKVAESTLTTVDGVPRSHEFEFSDGDLVGKDLAPIASYPPPAAMFAGVLGDCLFVDGAVGDTVAGVTAGAPGSTIAQSLPFFIEEFPPDWRMYPSEAPTALIRGGDDFYYRFGKNSMGVITYVGGAPPLHYQQLWSQVGVSYPHNVCIGEGGRMYAKTGKRGLVRVTTGGAIDSVFSEKMASIIAGYADENTVLGWDEDSQTLCVMHETEILPFSVNNGWGAPCDVSGTVNGNIVAAVTHLGSLYVAALNNASSTIDLFKYDAGSGSLMEFRTGWHYAEAQTEYLRMIEIFSRLDNTVNDVTVELYTDEDDTTPFKTWTITPDKATRLRPLKFGRRVESFQISVKHLSIGGDSAIEKIIVHGVPNFVTR